MTLSQAAAVATLIALILGAGLYIGRLEGRVTALETETHYLHGSFAVPKE